MAEKIVFEPFVSIDIGSFSLKFAHVAKGDDGKPTLKALAHMPIPQFTHMLTADEREKMSREDIEKDNFSKLHKFLTKHLTELLYDNQIQTKRAITLASGRPVTIRYIEISPPGPEPDALTVAVNTEATKQMPFSMENAVLGFSVIGNVVRNEKALQQIVVAALQKDVVANMTENLKGGGLSNEGILTLPQALELSLKSQLEFVPGTDKRVGIIHCGHKTTSIMIYKNGALNFYRDINMAGETITDAIFAGGEFEGQKIEFTNYDEVAELKHKIGILPPDEIKSLKGAEKFAAQQIFSTVEKIFQHIQLSISFYISQSAEPGLDQIILSGGSAAMKNFKDFIQESLEVPVALADPFKGLSIGEVNFPKEKFPTEGPTLAAAVGVGLFSDQPAIINFINLLFPNRRKQTIDFSKVSSKFSKSLTQSLGIDIQLDEKKIKIIAGLLIVFLILLLAYPLVKVRQDIKFAQQENKKLTNQFNELTVSQAEVTKLIEEKTQLEKEAGFPGVIQSLKFPNSELLLELASLTPRQIFLRNMIFTKTPESRTFKLSGQTDNSDRVFEYLKVLGQSTFFKSPSLESSDEIAIDEKRYFMQFVLSGKIHVPVAALPPQPAPAE